MVCEKTKGMKAEAVSLNSSLLRGNPHKLLPIDRLTLLFSYSTKAGEDHIANAILCGVRKGGNVVLKFLKVATGWSPVTAKTCAI